MIKLIKLLLLKSVLFAMMGCTALPPLDFTVQDVGMVNNRKDVELKSLTVGFAPQEQQRVVEADHGVPPIWKEALQDAISRSLIFKDNAPTKINLSVRIVEARLTGFAEVTCHIGAIYEIVNRNNGDLLFAQEISSKGIVPLDYAFVGVVRGRECGNRGVRNNIAEFINQLEQADLSKPMFPAQTQ